MMDGIGFGFTETSDCIISVKRALPTRANVLRTYPQEWCYFLPVMLIEHRNIHLAAPAVERSWHFSVLDRGGHFAIWSCVPRLKAARQSHQIPAGPVAYQQLNKG